MPDLGYEEEPPEEIKIAQITFAYDNKELINFCKQRGAFIKAEKWKKVKDINTKISKTIRDPYLLNKFQRPCSVFATFECEEGRARALVYNQTIKDPEFKIYDKLLGEEIELQEASEPTDIIWENRSFTPRERTIKRFVVYTIIFFMLTVSGSIIYSLTKTTNKLKAKYPPAPCNMFEDIYSGEDGFATWEHEAAKEFQANDRLF